MQRAYDRAKKYDETLRADNTGFNCSVQVIDDEGCVIFYNSAFLAKWHDPKQELNDDDDQGWWLFVFTEHHGFQVFSLGELNSYAQYARIHQVEEIE